MAIINNGQIRTVTLSSCGRSSVKLSIKFNFNFAPQNKTTQTQARSGQLSRDFLGDLKRRIEKKNTAVVLRPDTEEHQPEVYHKG